jgi:hypothetical protein
MKATNESLNELHNKWKGKLKVYSDDLSSMQADVSGIVHESEKEFSEKLEELKKNLALCRDQIGFLLSGITLTDKTEKSKLDEFGLPEER